MALRRHTTILIAAMLAILLSGCFTTARLVEEPASASALAKFVANKGGDATLVDGAIVRLASPVDYGDALCSNWVCVRKSEIASIRRWENSPSLDPAPALALASAPVIVAAYAVLAAGLCDGKCTSEDNERDAPAAAAHLYDASREWIGGYGDVPSACRPQLDAVPAAGMQGPELIMKRRFELSTACLWIAARELQDGVGVEDRERSLRLWALARIRDEWIDENCLHKFDRRPMLARISPAQAGYPAGLPSPFPIISETLMDETTYVLPGGLAAHCDAGLRPHGEAVDRATFVAVVDPFSRPDVHPNVFNDKPLQ